MRPVRINTTAWQEEDFLLLTNLTDKQIIKVIEPLVLGERNNPDDDGFFYDNNMLVDALKKVYPDNHITNHDMNDIDQITI